MQPYGGKKTEKSSMGHHPLAWVKRAIRTLKKRARQWARKEVNRGNDT